jgi:NADP-dependent 3-hydroxy acid dehydrogenase YdfG
MRPLAMRGARFYLVGRNKEKLTAVASDLLTRGAAAVAIRVMDLDDTTAHEAMFSEAEKSLEKIELALLAHGVLGDQEKAQASYAIAEAILRTNFLSAVSLITWLANYFEASRQGTLAVISSVAGDRGRKSNYVYGASKGALNIFLDGVRNHQAWIRGYAHDRPSAAERSLCPSFGSRPGHPARYRNRPGCGLCTTHLGLHYVCDTFRSEFPLQEAESLI